MYPPSNNNCNYSSILSSSSFHIPSPSMQYEHDLFLQSYHDQCYLQQQQQVPLIEDLSHSFDDILADSIETVTNPSNYTDNVKILNYNTETVTSCNHNPVLEGIEEEEEEEGGNKGNVVMSSRTSIIRGRISKNKRSSNKDRHSKINTARGPRDRRMRLSLDVALKFFSLQDLLGFDKASKTVEWLLIKSESAIEDVVAKANNEGAQLPQYINKQISCSTTTTTTGIGAICASNSISECEVISGTEETSSNDKNKETAKGEEKKKKKRIRKKKGKTARRAAFEPLARESRDRARARARERTKTKKISLIGKSKALANKTCEKQQQPELSTTIHQEKQLLLGTKENTVDNYNLVVNGNWNPLISIFNYQQNPRISHEHQFTDFQFCGKLWEA